MRTNIRELLKQAIENQMKPSELFPRLARELPTLYGGFEQPAPAGLPRMSIEITEPDGKKIAPLFVDQASIGEFDFIASSLQEVDSLSALRSALHTSADQVYLRFGQAWLPLDRKGVLLLMREFALLRLAEAGGAWVPTKDGSPLIIQVHERIGCIPAYLSEAECQAIAAKEGGKPAFHSWSAIWDRCTESSIDVDAMLFYGQPEQAGLPRPYIAKLCGDGRQHPLDAVERAIATGNTPLIQQALARLQRIWVLIDRDGDMTSLSTKGITLYTSAFHALSAAQQIPAATRPKPDLLLAQPLFRYLIDHQQPGILINGTWFGPADTVSGVVRLAQSLEAAAGAPPRPAAPQQAEKAQSSWLKRMLGRN